MKAVSRPFTVVGAGAIGGLVGAHLIEAGHAVTFIEANRAHVEAVRATGLTIRGARELTVHPEILLPDEARAPLDRVLLAVKARHTEDALTTVAPLLAEDGAVVSLQNGLEETKIARVVGDRRTVGAFLTFGGHYRRPGEIVYGGPGSFRIGELDGRTSARIGELRDALAALQPVEVTANIFGYLWAKLALGAVYFATALADEDVPVLFDDARYRALFGNLAAEVVAVAEASGVAVEDFDGFDPKVFRFGEARDPARVRAAWDAQRAYWGRHAHPRTGVWRDLAVHRRKTEVDELVGPVALRAAELGLETPRVRALLGLVRAVEAGEQALGRHHLEALCAADAEAERAGSTA